MDRYLVTRLRWVRPGDDLTTAQLSAMVRGMGFEDLAGTEHFTTGWGIAGTTRVRTTRKNNVQLGFVGGEGIGRYLFGLGSDDDLSAAGPDVHGNLTAVRSVGAFAGYQHVWSPDINTNIAYGYAHADTSAAMPADVTRTTQNAWANIILQLTGKLFVGLEYQYGKRLVNDGTQGENHRIQMTLSYQEKAVRRR